MQFQEQVQVSGVFLITPDFFTDERGGFARSFCANEFAQRDLVYSWVQFNLSRNYRTATLRGLHYQKHPCEEVKLLRCTRGAIFDVAVDLRPQSTTYGRWVGVTLTAESGAMLYIPKGCAHGLLTLEANTEVMYAVSTFYHPQNEAGVRWNDPSLNIQWPLSPIVISKKDQDWPDYEFTC